MAFDFYEFCSRACMSLLFWRGADRVGEDEDGNVYYRQKQGDGGRERRWVSYNGESEPSRVPPLWHAWLHHQTDALPDKNSRYSQPWVKEHVPNLTGTDAAYRPPGHVLKGGERPPATGDYEPWTPS